MPTHDKFHAVHKKIEDVFHRAHLLKFEPLEINMYILY